MILRRTSLISNKVNEMDLDITQEQLNRWRRGEKIQNVFPHLTADEREFIMTGITPEEWKANFGD